MRYHSCLFKRRRRVPERFGILSLLLGVAIISVLLALGLNAWALLVFLTALIFIVTDSAAHALFPNDNQDACLRVPVIRRFWHRSSASRNEWLTPDPIVLATVYIVFFLIWHLLLLMIFKRDGGGHFSDLTNGMGVSLRAMDHAVNAMLLIYLVVHLAVSLFPHAAANRNYRIALIVAIVVVATLHFAIF